MVDIDKAVVARITKFGSNFEILVDPDLAHELRSGKSVDLERVLAARDVFKDAGSGERCGEESLRKAFGTTDPIEVARAILEKGQLQLTAEQRRRMTEDRRRQVAALIARTAINPQTGAPHPLPRVERAMEEARVRVDFAKDAEAQVADVVKELRPILPLKFETRLIAVKVSAEHASRARTIVKGYGEVRKDEWQRDGSWIAVVEVPAGIQDEFFGKLAGLTHGKAESRILEHYP